MDIDEIDDILDSEVGEGHRAVVADPVDLLSRQPARRRTSSSCGRRIGESHGMGNVGDEPARAISTSSFINRGCRQAV
jgi:hypothetical protein